MGSETFSATRRASESSAAKDAGPTPPPLPPAQHGQPDAGKHHRRGLGYDHQLSRSKLPGECVGIIHVERHALAGGQRAAGGLPFAAPITLPVKGQGTVGADRFHLSEVAGNAEPAEQLPDVAVAKSAVVEVNRQVAVTEVDLPPFNSTSSRERIWGWSKPREATNATRKEGTGASRLHLSFERSRLRWGEARPSWRRSRRSV